HRHSMPGNRHTKRPDSIRQNRNRGRDTGRGTEQRKAGIRCRGKEERKTAEYRGEQDKTGRRLSETDGK
ncbi:MAG: hypothetical protein PUC34_04900, partial [Paludibacteraceae bacterium]|nr:hypothetical protein [Paludibacteraceae bacterium]